MSNWKAFAVIVALWLIFKSRKASAAPGAPYNEAPSQDYEVPQSYDQSET